MKSLPPPKSSGDPDPFLRIEMERPLENGGRLRVVSSIPQKTLWLIVAVIVGSLFGWPFVVQGLGLLASLRRVFF